MNKLKVFDDSDDDNDDDDDDDDDASWPYLPVSDTDERCFK